MRTMIRFAILALAALGAKAIYDTLAPRKEELRRTGSDFVDRAGAAAREVRAKVSDATGQVVSTAQQGAADIAAVARDQATEVQAAAAEAKDQALSDPAADKAEDNSTVKTSAKSGAK